MNRDEYLGGKPGGEATSPCGEVLLLELTLEKEGWCEHRVFSVVF
jgi:hypothetical protein